MKKKTDLFRSRYLIFLLPLLLGCQNNDDNVFDQEFLITDAAFQNFSENYNYQEGLIPADSYKIAVNLLSDNTYATRYGINPEQQNKISGISIKTLLDLKDYAQAGENINKLFLVQKNYHELYQTIENFLKEDGSFEEYQNGNLVFTNLDEISVKGNLIVSPRDTLPIKLHIEFRFDNGLIISDVLSTTLFSI